ncbi:helix-turn-helix domain-containing protein [Streptomyces sp. NBC_01077]|uniref:helix-turn-helix domain-containing protein n=1 Tax=Streptomyces sp. NBC_01077 TaxID=2903746 RepID=UPI00386507F9|nr:helix-turn-helix domain-containing protein [Streptomyces sp. NBC_01077]
MTPWAELAAEMRRIKGATELSYGQLAQRTHYSRSSWERFLNQKQLPTRVAVEQFALASGQDPRPLLIRLERSLAHETGLRTGAVREARSVRETGAAREAGAVRQGAPAALVVRRDSRTGARRGAGVVQPLGLVAAGAVIGGLVTLLSRAGRQRRTG